MADPGGGFGTFFFLDRVNAKLDSASEISSMSDVNPSPAASTSTSTPRLVSPRTAMTTDAASEADRPLKKKKRSGKVLDIWRARSSAASSCASSSSSNGASTPSSASDRDSSTTISAPASTAVVVAHNRLQPLNLGPSSSMTRIGQKEMNASLYWHLISLSAQASKFMTIGDRTVEDVLHAITRRRASDAEVRYENVVLASLAAIGACRSFHSSITGIVAPSLLSSPDELMTLALGERRDQACSSLVARAIETAEQSGLLDDREGASMEVLNILRIATSAGANSSSAVHKRTLTTNIVHKSHRLRLVDNMRKKGVGALAIPDEKGSFSTRYGGRTLEGDTILVFDAFYAIMVGEDLVVSEEMLDLYGIEHARPDCQSPTTRIDEQAAIAEVTCVGESNVPSFDKDADLGREDVQLDNIRQLRLLAKLRLEDPNLSPRVLQAFYYLFATIDERIRDLHDVRRMVRETPHFFAVPLLTLVALVTEASRRAKADESSAVARGIVDGARVRYLKWLKLFAKMVGSMGDSYADNHIRAIFVTKLAFLPSWIPIAIKGAQQHASQNGPLKEAEFGFEDLSVLHCAIKLATTVYACASSMEENLSRALAEVGQVHQPEVTHNTDGANPRTSTDARSGTPSTSSTLSNSVEVEPNSLAAKLVQRALRDLERW